MKDNAMSIVIAVLTCCIFTSCDTDEGMVAPPGNSENPELFYYSKRNGVNNIYKSDLQDDESPIIIDNDHHDWWVRISPNRQTLLWYKSPINVSSDNEFNNYEQAALWMANIDGSNPHKVIDLNDHGWSAQGVADWSPSGTQLVMAAKTGNTWQIYLTDSGGKNPVKISQDDNKDYADPSWSPDGQKNCLQQIRWLKS